MRGKRSRDGICHKALACMCFVLLMVLFASCGRSAEAQIKEQLDLGHKYMTELNYDQAVIAYNKVLEIDPKNVEAYLALADIYEHQGDMDKARETLEKALAEVPSDADLQSRYEKLMGPADEASDQTEGMEGAEDTEQKRQDGSAGQTSIIISDAETLKWAESLYEAGDYEGLINRAEESFGLISELAADHPGRIYYEGDTNQSVPDGFGIGIYGDGLKQTTFMYIGSWKNGVRSGQGTALFKKGDNYGYCTGGWDNDIQNGDIKVRYKDRESSGTAVNGLAEGTYTEIYTDSSGNISGYEFNCSKGIPQSYGVMQTEVLEVTEEVMAYMISNGKRQSVWHPWAGLRCTACHDSSEGIDAVMNSADHSWAGWEGEPKTKGFYAD